jgi:hypothetical protein
MHEYMYISGIPNIKKINIGSGHISPTLMDHTIAGISETLFTSLGSLIHRWLVGW